MIASEYYTLPGKELKVVTPGDTTMHAIPGQDTLAGTPGKDETASPVAEAFSIRFGYNQKQYITKVLKAGDSDHAFYKVIVSSRMSGHPGVYWLQQKPEGWTVLLGQDLEQPLLQAITQAIETR